MFGPLQFSQRHRRTDLFYTETILYYSAWRVQKHSCCGIWVNWMTTDGANWPMSVSGSRFCSELTDSRMFFSPSACPLPDLWVFPLAAQSVHETSRCFGGNWIWYREGPQNVNLFGGMNDDWSNMHVSSPSVVALIASLLVLARFFSASLQEALQMSKTIKERRWRGGSFKVWLKAHLDVLFSWRNFMCSLETFRRNQLHLHRVSQQLGC